MSIASKNNRNGAPQSAEDFDSRPAFAEVDRTIRHAPPRYRNEIGKFSVFRSSACVECGKCIEGLSPRRTHQSRRLPFDSQAQRLLVYRP